MWLLLALFSVNAFAGRPVFHNLTLPQLAEQSDFVFTGWPSRDKPVSDCKHEMGRWWVHQVLKGDRTLENKVIALAEHSYQIHAAAKGGNLPSYPSNMYSNKGIDREQGSSFLFTNRRSDGCFELTAVGAQESRMNELEVKAVFAPMDCDLQMRLFQREAERMPRDCKVDADCKIFYTHPNSCGKPFVWKKDASLDAKFQAVQNQARTACSSEWKGQPACSPEVFPIRCQASKCEEGIAAGAPKPNFQFATISDSCAPHDASSKQISLRVSKKSDYPLLSVNWWGKNKPTEGGGDFVFPDTGDMRDATVSYCAYKGGCARPKQLKFLVHWPKGAKTGTVEFSITTESGDVISGSAPLEEPADAQRALCG